MDATDYSVFALNHTCPCSRRLGPFYFEKESSVPIMCKITTSLCYGTATFTRIFRME